MEITREINGELHTFEITSQEMLDAYYEQEFKNDRYDMEEYIQQIEEDDFIETYGRSLADAEKELDDLAYLLRKNIDKYDMHWTDARDEALEAWSKGDK